MYGIYMQQLGLKSVVRRIANKTGLNHKCSVDSRYELAYIIINLLSTQQLTCYLLFI